MEITYAAESGESSRRAIWPIALAYYEEKQIVAAWCTVRRDFRNFRIDRIRSAAPTEARYGKRRAQLATEWEAAWQEQQRQRQRHDGAGSDGRRDDT